MNLYSECNDLITSTNMVSCKVDVILSYMARNPKALDDLDPYHREQFFNTLHDAMNILCQKVEQVRNALEGE